MVHGEVRGEMKDEILGRQAQGALPGQRDRHRALPHAGGLRLVPRVARLGQQCPVQVDPHAGGRLVHDRAVEGDVEIPGVLVGQRHVAEPAQGDVGAPTILRAHQQIEIAEGPERGIRIDGLGQHRTLERDDVDAFGRPVAQHACQLARHHEMTRAAGGEAIGESLTGGRRHGIPSPRARGVRQRRQHILGLGQREQCIPVEIGRRRRGRLAATERLEAGEQPARLG